MANVNSSSPVSFLQKLILIAAMALAVYAVGKTLIHNYFYGHLWIKEPAYRPKSL
jgi:hypothetical protein